MSRKLTKIIIDTIPYTIKYRDDVEKVSPEGEDDCWGYVDFTKRVISILDDGKPTEDIAWTLFHEIMHIVIEHNGLKTLKKESEIDRLALAWLAALNTNGLLNLDNLEKRK